MVINIFFLNVISVIISQVLESVVCFTHANALKYVNFHAFCTDKCVLNSVNGYGITRLKGYIRNASIWGEGVQLSGFLGVNPAVVFVTRAVDPKAYGSSWCLEGSCKDLLTFFYRCEAVSME